MDLLLAVVYELREITAAPLPSEWTDERGRVYPPYMRYVLVYMRLCPSCVTSQFEWTDERESLPAMYAICAGLYAFMS